MPFDPTKPANNSPVNSAELRSQLTSLKTLIDDRPTSALMSAFVLGNSGGNCDNVVELAMTVSSPPTQAEMQQIADKLDEVIFSLRRI